MQYTLYINDEHEVVSYYDILKYRCEGMLQKI